MPACSIGGLVDCKWLTVRDDNRLPYGWVQISNSDLDEKHPTDLCGINSGFVD